MSWFIGAVGNIEDELKQSITNITDTKLSTYDEENFYLLSGGISPTHISSTNTDGGFIVAGSGITSNEKKKFLSRDDWQRLLENRTDLYKLDGHFALVFWNKHTVELHTDIIGLRDIYLFRTPADAIVFSTRIDWILKLQKTELDFQKFGSRWLLFSQLTTESIFKNIIRLVAGKSLIINRHSFELEHHQHNWQPVINSNDGIELNFESRLKELTIFPLNDNTISLSLSGGLDSRTLFSLLANINAGKWDTHSFGLNEHPDPIIAKRISKFFGIEHRQIFNSNTDNLVNELEDFLLQTVINTSAVSFLQLRHYSLLKNSSEIVIDGAFGEIYRKEFLKKLRILGPAPLKGKNIDKLYELFYSPKPDFFSKDIIKLMSDGARLQIEEIIDSLPDIRNIGIDNYSNILAIKTKIPNHFCCEQSRIDSIVKSYMPYVQPSLLNFYFSLNNPPKNILKEIIKHQRPELRGFPLVKGETVYPYQLSGIGANIYKRLKEIFFRKSFQNAYIPVFKELLLTYLNELIKTNQLFNPDIYDKSKIMDYLERANNGIMESETILFLDWLLSFELFYRQVKSSSLVNVNIL